MTKLKPTVLFSAVLLLFCTHLWGGTDKYRLTIRDNPTTSIVIGWNQASGSNPIVYYGKTDYGTNWASYPYSNSVSRQVLYGGMYNHFARLTGLEPNTAYYFVIKDSEGTSQRFWFKTAPDSSTERLSFIAGGDSRNNRTPRINANKLVAKLRPHAVLFGGDMTAYGTDSEWRQWFDDWQYTTGSDGRMIPIVATRGNHESSNSMIYNLFDTPSSEVYYALTFGGDLIRTYTLNTEISISGNQTTWLQNDLAANSGVIWKMAQYHKPMRPHVSSKSEGYSQYSNWASLFYNSGVKLVVECDAHTVKTTWPVKPSTGSNSDEGFERDDANGTVYTGEGCWGAPLRTNNDDKSWTRNSASFNQFKWIFVDESKIETRTIKVDNADQVGQVSDNNIFTAPANLDIWNPGNGAVVTITNDNTPDDGEVTVSSRINSTNDDVEENQNGSMYMNSSDIELVYDGSKGNQTIGLRFKGLSIPQGATILSAHVQFTVDETNSGTTNLTIKGHDSDNSPAFSTASYDVSSRSTTSASINWNPSAWNSVGQAGSSQKTPDLKPVVQELVNRSGWSQSSALSLIITGTGERTAESYDGTSSSAPIIYVTYTTDGGGTTPPADVTFAKRVSSGNDDAEESSSGSMYLSSSDLELVYDSYLSAGNQKVGMRFTNVTIPQGVTIKKAYIQFTVDETANSSGTKTIYGEDSDHSSAFSSGSYNISNRSMTSASVSWSPPSWSTVGAASTDQRTPDITQIIQEIVNRGGWYSGNALSLIITGSGRRVAESYNGSSSNAPLLVVEYTNDATNTRIALNTDNSKIKQAEEREPIKNREIPVFPNPVTDILTIDLQGVEEKQVVMIVYSLNGEKIISHSLIGQASNQLSLEALPAGVYILKVFSSDSMLKQMRITKI